ncbi:MAG: lysophospholipid acyltransferase family protein [Thermodesulfobacteriota bacterium]
MTLGRARDFAMTLYRLGVIGGVTAGMAVPALAALAAGKDNDWGHAHLRRFWSGGILRGCGIRAEARGLQLLDPKSTYVFVSSHASEWDWYLFTHLVPFNWRAVIRADLRRFPLGGPLAARTGQLFLPPRASADELVELCRPQLARGCSILMYPEGRRPRPNTLAEFRPGAFVLAARMRVAVAPIAVVEQRPAARRGALGRGFGHDPGRVCLVAGEPLEPRGAGPEDVEELRRAAQASVARLMTVDWRE